MGILEVRVHFLKKYYMRPWNLVYGYIVGTFRWVRKVAPVGQIYGPFLVPNRVKIGQFIGFLYFLKRFPLDSQKLDLFTFVGA